MKRNTIIRTTVYAVLALFFVACQTQSEWNVNDFGALADGETVNTEAIQAAIDACSKAGGGKVIVDGGEYVTGTLLLKNNVNLHVTAGTKLLSSCNPNDFVPIDPFIDATGQYRGQCMIGAIDVKNVAITGKGIIDGRGEQFSRKEIEKTLKRLGVEEIKHDFSHLVSKNNRYVNNDIRYGNRPFLVRFVRVTDCKFENITLRQPAAWTLHFFQCDKFVVDGIEIYSHANRNNDGIDIDSSTNGVIKNSHINSGDDAVCIKGTSSKPTQYLEVYNCRLSSHWGAIKFGTESMGDFKDITVKNCTIYDNKGGGIKILSVDGSNIENVVIDSIKMDNVDMPLFIRLGERGLAYRGDKQRPVGSIKNVSISNITATTRSLEESRVNPPTGIFITGTPNHKIENVKISNIDITLPGGGTEADANKVVPENETVYPEFTKFDGCVPAYGLYARHVNNLQTENIKFTLLSHDKREEVIFDDVK